jgi:hypothetical protein
MLTPMLERELRVALLHRRARRQWVRSAWVAGAICTVFLLFLGLTRSHETGRGLFRLLFALGCLGVVSRGFGLTADLFSEERRTGTLGLLVLTGLSPLEIFINKLLGAAMLTAYSLLGGLPFFSISFLTGGVPGTQFVCALAFLLNGLWFCIAVGLLASVLHREGGQAQTTAFALTGLLCLASPFCYWVGWGASTAGQWLVLSPAYAPWLVFGNFTGNAAHQFWVGSGFTLLYSLAALLLAAGILQRTWREGTEALVPQWWQWAWRLWMRGGQSWRRRLRLKLNGEHPFCWLAARDRGPVLLARGYLALAAGLWVVGWSAKGPGWLAPDSALGCSFVLHQGLNWILAYAASRRFALERQSGGFEVLLTAPIKGARIVDDQFKALLVQFRPELVVVLALDLGLATTGFVADGRGMLPLIPYVLGWGLYLLFWFALHLDTASRAFWISAWTGRAGYSALQATRTALSLLIWAWLVHYPMSYLLRSGSGGAMVAILLAICVPAILLTFNSRHVYREKLTKELRRIACAPIPARGDKRFKKWEPAKIFPPH